MNLNGVPNPGNRITLNLKYGSRARERWGTELKLNQVDHITDNSEWQMVKISESDDSITISVMPKADALIGEYEIAVQLDDQTVESNEKIFVICNPWCPQDVCYMQDEVGVK